MKNRLFRASSFLTIIAATWLTILSSLSRPCLGAPPVIKCPWGRVVGRTFRSQQGMGYHGYLRIPYALPPTGNRRWSLPVPHPGMEEDGVFFAEEYGPACPQAGQGMDTSEDCLTLNVFTPISATRSDNNRKPVMVWLHGGFFLAGSASQYSPGILTTQGDVIVVIIQYRLGILGFLSSGNDAVPGNFGLWDQSLALRWVKSNIAAFGGDPDSVTIFGQASGAVSAGMQLLSPYSRGLFARVVLQSGSPVASWALNPDPEIGFRFLAQKTGCWDEAENDLALVWLGKRSKRRKFMSILTTLWNRKLKKGIKNAIKRDLVFSWLSEMSDDLWTFNGNKVLSSLFRDMNKRSRSSANPQRDAPFSWFRKTTPAKSKEREILSLFESMNKNLLKDSYTETIFSLLGDSITRKSKARAEDDLLSFFIHAYEDDQAGNKDALPRVERLPNAKSQSELFSVFHKDLWNEARNWMVKDCLKKKKVEDLLPFTVLPNSPRDFDLYTSYPYIPVVDGHFLPRHPAQLLGDPEYLSANDVISRDVMLGMNNEEGNLYRVAVEQLGVVKNSTAFVLSEQFLKQHLKNDLKYQYGGKFLGRNENKVSAALDVLRLFYQNQDGRMTLKRLSQLSSDTGYAVPAVRVARHLSSAPPPSEAALTRKGRTYLYSFDYAPTSRNGQGSSGMQHGDDLGFLFDDWPVLSRGNLSRRDEKVADAFVKLLTDFAKCGNPTASMRTQWPAFTEPREVYLSLGSPSEVKDHLLKNRVTLWTDLVPRLLNTTLGEFIITDPLQQNAKYRNKKN